MDQIPLFGISIPLQLDKILLQIYVIIELILFVNLEIKFNFFGAV